MNKHEDLFSKVKIRKFPDKNYHAIWNNLKTVRLGEGVAKEYNTGVVPNYTTNGITLASDNCGKLLEYTSKYCGGVAVSFSNPSLRECAEKAVSKLLSECDVKVNIHHIISTKESVDEFFEIQQRYGDKIYYHVLLPLMPSGRSKEGIQEGVWEYLEEIITANSMKNVSFGAHFISELEKSNKIKTWLYPAESLSKNIILTENCVKITPSSFNLKPIKEIKL